METEEQLEQFRLQWQKELQKGDKGKGKNTDNNNKEENGDTMTATATATGDTRVEAGPSKPTSSKADIFNRRAVVTTTTTTTTDNAAQTLSSSSSSLSNSTVPSSSAVQLYSKAVQAEREGRMNDALTAYRAAFRKDDNVDKVYHKMQQTMPEGELEAALNGGGNQRPSASSTSTVDELAFTYQRTLQLEPDYERQKQLKRRMMTASYVEQLLTGFRENPYIPEAERKEQKQLSEEEIESIKGRSLAFLPRSPLRGFYISKLPDELLLHILSFLTTPSPNARSPDMSSFERGFSLTCRKARILTLQSASPLWKSCCLFVYRAPLQIDSPATATQICESSFGGDWRLMWIEQPRIRTDGVYISRITYLRKGANEIGNSLTYFDPSYSVTYFRYLVFLPTGDVVSLLSHDIPSVIVPNLLASASSRSSTANSTTTSSSSSSSSKHSKHSSTSTSASTLSAGYTVGRWRLVHVPAGSSVDTDSIPGSTSSSNSSSTIVELSSLEDPRIRSPSEIKYSFRMLCRLKSTTRGKNNKLEMLSLLARNHRTGDESPIPMMNRSTTTGGNGNGMPSFYFSRVMSYD